MHRSVRPSSRPSSSSEGRLRAASSRIRNCCASWLYGVARFVAYAPNSALARWYSFLAMKAPAVLKQEYAACQFVSAPGVSARDSVALAAPERTVATSAHATARNAGKCNSGLMVDLADSYFTIKRTKQA